MDEYSTGRFPHFQRILTFLANCGLQAYGFHLFRIRQSRHLFYPFDHPANYTAGRWFSIHDEELSLQDESILQQQEQSSLDAGIFVGEVFADAMAYRLELEHGYYRLRYSLLTTARRRLIRDLLAEKEITQYEFAEEENEGKTLPPYQDSAEIDDCSGCLVTPAAIYGFWLDYVDGRYTLGDGSTFLHNGEECSFWEEYTPEDIRPNGNYPGIEREVEGARRRLHLRKPTNILASDGEHQMWELREEDAEQ